MCVESFDLKSEGKTVRKESEAELQKRGRAGASGQGVVHLCQRPALNPDRPPGPKNWAGQDMGGLVKYILL